MKALYILLLTLALALTSCEKPDPAPVPQPEQPEQGGKEEDKEDGKEDGKEDQGDNKEDISLLPEEGTMTDPRDGNEYVTVKLGEQVWMAENLRYLPEGETQDFDISPISPRYYVIFDNDLDTELGTASVDMYGMFYNLPAATQEEELVTVGENRIVQGVCPDGWHLPSQAEWDALAQFLLKAGMAATLEDGTVDETALGKALASTDMWIMPEMTEIEPLPTWVAYDPSTNNASKFNGKPLGFRACSVNPGEDVWMHACYSAGWWSSSAAVAMTGMGVDFGIPVRIWSDSQNFITVSEFNPAVALPVRCLKN